MAKVSIIVPVYNTDKYLDRCLTSLIQQTLTDIEIICIDDGSVDKSAQILERFAKKDKRVIVIHQTNDKGPGKARNVGVHKSSSPYIMFCDSDDWYEKDMCEVMYKTIDRENVDVVQCNCFIDIDSTKEKEKRGNNLDDDYFNSRLSGVYDLNIDVLFNKTNVLLWEKIFRKDVIVNNNILFLRHHRHDDVSFWFMYGIVAKSIFFLEKPLYHYVVRENSIMAESYQNRMDDEYSYKDVVLYMKKYCVQIGMWKDCIKYMLPYYCSFLYATKYKHPEKFVESLKEVNEECAQFNIDTRIVLFKDKLLPVLKKSKFKLRVRQYWYKFVYYMIYNKLYKNKSNLAKETLKQIY